MEKKRQFQFQQKSKVQEENIRNLCDFFANINIHVVQKIQELCSELALKKGEKQFNNDSKTKIDALKLYFKYYSIFMEKQRYNSANLINQINKTKELDYKTICLNKNILPQTKWVIRFSKQFQMKLFEDQIISRVIFKIVIMRFLADGNFVGMHCSSIPFYLIQLNFFETFDYCAFYLCRIHDVCDLFFNVGVEKVPFYNKQDSQKCIQFKPYIKFINIFSQFEYYEKINKEIELQLSALKKDQLRGQSVVKKVKLIQNPHGRPLFQRKEDEKYQRIVQNSIRDGCVICFDPPQFEKISNRPQKKQYKEKGFIRKRQIYQKNPIQQIIDQTTMLRYIYYLENTPQFQITLTNQERETISEQGNVVVIGRSGTGKTTCAVLRLFILQLMYRNQNYQQRTQNQNFSLIESFRLHSAFVTASEKLTLSIKSYYQKLKQKIRKRLKQRQRQKSLSNPQQKVEEQNIQKKSNQKQNKLDQKKLLNKSLKQILNESKQKKTQYLSFNDLKSKDYPGFFTVQEFINMIDQTLLHPFYQWDEQIEEVKTAAFHKKQNKTRSVVIYKNHWNVKTKIGSKRSFEIDFKYFSMYFWPQIKRKYDKQKNINPHIIWTQIFSTIKGSANSHTYPQNYLTKQVYLDSSLNIFLEKNHKKQIYDTFLDYQSWKSKVFAYDFMDVINYIIRQINQHGYEGPSLHYLMIDEVQDLPHSTICLLTKIVQNRIFFGGDTAQTIAKGVGFKFGDLRTLFEQKKFEKQINFQKPVVHQLTVNFRSHNNILRLANSIVCLIECLFPKTIDKLKKQISDYVGPKPMILINRNEYFLESILSGSSNYSDYNKNKLEDISSRPDLQFGCNQAIIVRDQQSKEKVPLRLRGNLILTVHQAKGLEFNDVIVFNFFTDCPCKEQWSLMTKIRIIEQQVDKDVYWAGITKRQHNQQQQENTNFQTVEGVIERNGKIILKKVKPVLSNSQLKTANQYSQFCSDLKLLYTAVTRTRNILIIYDEEQKNRNLIQSYWQQMNITSTINSYEDYKRNFKEQQQTQQKKEKNVEKVKEKDVENPEERVIKQTKKFIQQTSIEQWREQGKIMMQKKLYQQAMLCFKRSKDFRQEMTAKANFFAIKATITTIECEVQKKNMDNNEYSDIPKYQLRMLKKSLKQKESFAKQNFLIAAEAFKNIEYYEQAAQCYFSGKSYHQAVHIFIQLGKPFQAAECYANLGQFHKAANFYQQAGQFLKQIQCLDQLPDRQKQILYLLRQKTQNLEKKQRDKLFLKYALSALAKLIKKLSSSQIQIQDQNLIIQNIIQISCISQKDIQVYFEQFKKQHSKIELCSIQIQQNVLLKILKLLSDMNKIQLCVFISNRYYLIEQFSRHFTSLLFEISQTPKNNMKISEILIYNCNQNVIRRNQETFSKQIQIQKARLQKSIKNNQNYLSQQLGVNFSLSLLLLGYPKGIPQFYDCNQTATIFYSYFCDEAFRYYFMHHLSKKQNQSVKLLKNKCSDSKIEQIYALILFERCLWRKMNENNFVNQVFQNNIFLSEFQIQTTFFTQDQNFDFPSQCCFNKSFWEYTQKYENIKISKKKLKNNQVKSKIKQNKQSLKANMKLRVSFQKTHEFKQFIEAIKKFIRTNHILYEEINEFSQIQIYDIITFGILLLFSKHLTKIHKYFSFDQILNLHEMLQKNCQFLTTLQFKNSKSKFIPRAILCLFHVRMRDQSVKSTNCFGDLFVFVHKNSSLIRNLLSFNKKTDQTKDFIKFNEQAFLAEQTNSVILSPFLEVVKLIQQRLAVALFHEFLEYSIYFSTSMQIKFSNLSQSNIFQKQKQCILSCYHLQLAHRLLCNYQILNLYKFKKNKSRETFQKNFKFVESKNYNIKGKLLSQVFHQHSNLNFRILDFLDQTFKCENNKIDVTKLLYISGVSFSKFKGSSKHTNCLAYALECKHKHELFQYVDTVICSLVNLHQSDKLYYIWDCILNLIIHLKRKQNSAFEMNLPLFLLKHLKNIQRCDRQINQKDNNDETYLFECIHPRFQDNCSDYISSVYLKKLIEELLSNKKLNMEQKEVIGTIKLAFKKQKAVLSQKSIDLMFNSSVTNKNINKNFNKVLCFEECQLSQKEHLSREQHRKRFLKKYKNYEEPPKEEEVQQTNHKTQEPLQNRLKKQQEEEYQQSQHSYEISEQQQFYTHNQCIECENDENDNNYDAELQNQQNIDKEVEYELNKSDFGLEDSQDQQIDMTKLSQKEKQHQFRFEIKYKNKIKDIQQKVQGSIDFLDLFHYNKYDNQNIQQKWIQFNHDLYEEDVVALIKFCNNLSCYLVTYYMQNVISDVLYFNAIVNLLIQVEAIRSKILSLKNDCQDLQKMCQIFRQELNEIKNRIYTLKIKFFRVYQEKNKEGQRKQREKLADDSDY